MIYRTYLEGTIGYVIFDEKISIWDAVQKAKEIDWTTSFAENDYEYPLFGSSGIIERRRNPGGF